MQAILNAFEALNQDDETRAIAAFKGMPRSERVRVAAALRSLCNLLESDSKFQPILFSAPFRVWVETQEQSRLVQEKLHSFGCGQHYGSYPLAKDVVDTPGVRGIFVGTRGAISVSLAQDGKDYFDNHEWKPLTVEQILAAASPQDLLSR